MIIGGVEAGMQGMTSRR